MFAGINMFWARLRLILARAVRLVLKWALRRAQNIFISKNMNSITIIITLEGIERMNTEKMTTKRSEEYFFHQRCKETSRNFVMVSRLWLAAYIVRLFDSHCSFQGTKIDLSPPNSPFQPFKMRHNARQTDNNSCFTKRIDHSLLVKTRMKEKRFSPWIHVNYHVSAFSAAFQRKVAWSASFREKPWKLVDLAKTNIFFRWCSFS